MKNNKEVCEPALSYANEHGVRNSYSEPIVTPKTRKDCMTVDEYINLIKEELDKRYENL